MGESVRYSLDIAGIDMAIKSNLDEKTVHEIATEISEKIDMLVRCCTGISKTKAAVLAAMEFDERVKLLERDLRAAQRARAPEAEERARVYEDTNRALSSEIDELRAELASLRSLIDAKNKYIENQDSELALLRLKTLSK